MEKKKVLNVVLVREKQWRGDWRGSSERGRRGGQAEPEG